MARSMGIPARIDEVTGKVQLIIGDERPVDVDFEAVSPSAAQTGKLIAKYNTYQIIGRSQVLFSLHYFKGDSRRNFTVTEL